MTQTKFHAAEVALERQQFNVAQKQHLAYTNCSHWETKKANSSYVGPFSRKTYYFRWKQMLKQAMLDLSILGDLILKGSGGQEHSSQILLQTGKLLKLALKQLFAWQFQHANIAMLFNTRPSPTSVCCQIAGGRASNTSVLQQQVLCTTAGSNYYGLYIIFSLQCQEDTEAPSCTHHGLHQVHFMDCTKTESQAYQK